jgi:hypothetical protein
LALEIKIFLKGNPANAIYPCYRVILNDQLLSDGTLPSQRCLSFEVIPKDRNILQIIHHGKTNRDTKTDASGKIIEDRSIEIQGLTIGGIQIMPTVLNMKKFYVLWPENLIIDYKKRNQDPPQYLVNNLYLGFNGTYEFDFPGDPNILRYEQLWLDEIQAHHNQTMIKDGMEVFTRPDGDSGINKEFDLTIYDLERLIKD